MLTAEDRGPRVFERKEHFIGGNWQAASGGDLLEVISPSTEEIVGRVPVAGPAEIDDYVSRMKVGDPHDADTDFGPLAAARQRDNAERFIAWGLAEGVKVVLGGSRPASQPKGWYVEPTIFTEVDNRMEIAQEEIFGPVLSVISYRDEAEAIAIANDSMYGLGGAVFAADVEHGLEVAAKIITGTCSVNGGPPSGGGGPFGGRKQSGLGCERAVEGLESILELKSVALPAGYELRGE